MVATMLMSNFLKNRRSVREFKDRQVKGQVLDKLLEIFKSIEEEASGKSFNFILFKDGRNVYKLLEGEAGYAGVMIKSPHYIGVRLKEVTEPAIIEASYYTEKLMGKLTELNLGSCWVNVKYADKGLKAAALGGENKNIGYLVAFGYPKAKNPFLDEPVSARYSIEEIVFKEEFGNKISLQELEDRGLDDLFYYIRFAPSNYNKQPWRFILKKDRVQLLLEVDEGRTDLMDAGIIMYYFEEMAKTIGLRNKWKLVDKEVIQHEGKEYRLIGEYSI